MQESASNKLNYPQKIWIKGGIYALIVVLLLLIKATFPVFMLALAGILIALYFRGLSHLIYRKTKWNENICLTISIVGTLCLIAGIFWLIGAKLQDQIAKLSDIVPSIIENMKVNISQSATGKKIIEKVLSPQSIEKAQHLISTLFKSTFGFLGDIYVVLFLAIFFTASPAIYKNGLIQLIPREGRGKGEDIINKLGDNLKKWLKGKLFAMFIVTVLTAIGLLIVGIPMWLALAIIAGILSFIPNFGPLIAMILAVLVASMQGTTMVIIVACLYIVIQVVESNFITPLVQQKLTKIPPALIILAQLLISLFVGGWGLVLATPIMLILMIMVKELYVKKQEAA